MTNQVAHDGQGAQSEEYLVPTPSRKPKAMWVPTRADLEWIEPEDENTYIEFAVWDAADGRLIPGLGAGDPCPLRGRGDALFPWQST